jgi:hypothetical protein
MSAIKNPHQMPTGETKTPEPPTVWEIMNESVNDNTPGFMYWFVRIGTASLICAILLGVLRNWMG